MSKNMFYICGQAAYKLGHKIVCNLNSFAQYPQILSINPLLKSYTQFYTSSYTRACAQKCMQFSSGNRQFYTLYTAPTITTTLNN
jgi:hypothetical protein